MVKLMKCMIIKKLHYCKILRMIVFCQGGDIVAREDIMDAIEREKYGVNGRQKGPDSAREGLTKLFPWLPKPGNKPSNPDDFQGLMGYHTLS